MGGRVRKSGARLREAKKSERLHLIDTHDQISAISTMNLQLENKLALVSGSTAGIGFAIAKALAAEGARVIVNGRTDARVGEAIASIRAGISSPKLQALSVTLSKAEGAAEAIKRYPYVYILL